MSHKNGQAPILDPATDSPFPGASAKLHGSFSDVKEPALDTGRFIPPHELEVIHAGPIDQPSMFFGKLDHNAGG